MMPRAPILLCCDVDPDRNSGSAKDPGGFTWDGLSKGIPRILGDIVEIEKDLGSKILFNWFFRSDLQMELIYKDAAWPYKAWMNIVNLVSRRGDEVGWHPHFWRLHSDGSSWFQETEDLEYMSECLQRGFRAIPIESRPRAVRTGWDFHNAFTMKCISELGLAADLSALPGVKDKGENVPMTDKKMVVRDWAGAPDRPYIPSSGSHKREAAGRDDRLSIVEIPVSTYLLPSTLRLAKGLRDKVRRVEGRSPFSEPYLTKSDVLYKAAIDYHVAERDAAIVPFVVEFHADELLPANGAFSLTNATRNLALTVSRFEKAGMSPSFCRASDVAREIWKRLGG